MTISAANPLILDDRFTAPSCSTCGFSSRDLGLLKNHSCDITLNGGVCEDYPCCGHERGDCNGLLYGSDAAIQADPHLLCDHNTGFCEVDYDDDRPDDYCSTCDSEHDYGDCPIDA